MYKTFKALIITLFCIMVISPVANASETVAINDLIENAQVWSGREVTVSGETIGEALERGAYSWVNINDGTNAIGVWLKTEDTKRITYYGDYKHIGDTIQITGTFNRDCNQHGGDLDIHCTKAEIIKKGYVVKENISAIKIYIGSTMLLLTAIVIFLYIKFIRKPKSIITDKK